jgi:predicted Zn-dependent peptidase
MERLEYKGLNRDLYYEKLDNGLEIFIFPMPKHNNTFATFISKYGSNHNNFRVKGEQDFHVVPHGIAHFLEHKLFESEDGIDPFAFFANNGAHCNANTSFYRTVYLFEGLDNFESNLNYLMDYVQKPYLTDENVLKEKGIITEEAKMYLDYPSERQDIITKNNLFHNDYMKINTIGTLESINNISKEDLMLCYNTFYHPSNMFITIAGPVDPQETVNIIKNNQSNKQYKDKVEIEFNYMEEPDSVVKSFEEIKLDVSVPNVSINYKINYKKFGIDISYLLDYFQIYLNIKFGVTSLLANKLIDEKKILGRINTDIGVSSNHILLEISFDSEYPEEVIELIKEEMLKKEIDLDSFSSKQKMLIASLIASNESITSVVYNLIEPYTTFGNIYLDRKDRAANLNFDELNKILSEESFEHNTTTILKPLKD